jgi:hypothetical protein
MTHLHAAHYRIYYYGHITTLIDVPKQANMAQLVSGDWSTWRHHPTDMIGAKRRNVAMVYDLCYSGGCL